MAFNTVSALLAAGGEDISNLFVVIMGVGIVFLGLLSIVILTTIMSAVIRAFEGKKKEVAPAAAPAGRQKGLPRRILPGSGPSRPSCRRIRSDVQCRAAHRKKG